jgi:curved DNA-binding protein CbpA
MAFKNYYILLGINNAASLIEIKAAYRVLAKKYHPDKNSGNQAAEEKFKEVQEAYAVLSNPVKRKKYDLSFSTGGQAYTQAANKTHYTAYTGNAYQYAQQQAQYRKRQKKQATQTTNSDSEDRPQKNETKERYQILVSVGIALILLYFIVTFSSEKRNARHSENTKEAIK